MNSMTKSISLLIIAIVIKIRSESEICQENSGKPKIVEAFRIEDNAVLLTAEHNYYHIKGFKYESTGITFQAIEKLENWTTLKNVKLLLTIRYPNITSGDIRVIAISFQKREEIAQLVGYVIELDDQMGIVGAPKEFTINIYKTVPFEDPIDLKTLFLKFPQEDMDELMNSVMSFPLNHNNLPERLFAYYLERVTVNKSIETKFKRHIMIPWVKMYGPNVEIDWRHDVNSSKCVEQNSVDASFALSDDYTASGVDYEFDLIEFSKNDYFIKKVKLSSDRVDTDLSLLKNGSVVALLGCSEKAPDATGTTSGDVAPNKTPGDTDLDTSTPAKPTVENKGSKGTTRKRSNKSGSRNFVWISLVLLAIVAIVILATALALYFCYSDPQKETPYSPMDEPEMTGPPPEPEPPKSQSNQSLTKTKSVRSNLEST